MRLAPRTRRIAFHGLVLVVFVVGAGCGDSKAPDLHSSMPAQWIDSESSVQTSRVDIPEVGCSVEIPEGWLVNREQPAAALQAALSQDARIVLSLRPSTGTANINLIVTSGLDAVSRAELFSLQREVAKRLASQPGFTDLGQTEIEVGGRPCLRSQHLTSLGGSQSAQEQLSILTPDGALYVFTLTCNHALLADLSTVLCQVAASLETLDVTAVPHEAVLDPRAVHDSDLGFSFIPPNGWMSRPAVPPVFFKYSNFEDQRYVNILRADGPPASAESIRDEILSQGNVDSDGFVDVDEIRSYWMKRKAKIGGQDLVVYQVAIPAPRGGAFIATFTSMTTDFERAMEQFSETIASIRVSR